MTLPRLITGFRELADDYNAILCDVWGVLHNGREPFVGADTALARKRHRQSARRDSNRGIRRDLQVAATVADGLRVPARNGPTRSARRRMGRGGRYIGRNRASSPGLVDKTRQPPSPPRPRRPASLPPAPGL